MVEESKQAQTGKKQAPKDNYKHIVRIANVDIPGGKSLRIALTKIKGIGINFADALCAIAAVNKSKKTGTLDDEEIKRINDVATNPKDIPTWMYNRKRDYETGEDKHLITGTLNFVKDNDLKRLKKIKTLRGMRHQKGLPVRGQRTRSNFRKSKGKVVGVKKKGTPGKK
jgi:small subunit ribosomal protein S13